MKVLALLSAVLGAAACAAAPIPPSAPMTDGPAVAPPAGWADYCRRNPGDASC